MEKNKVVGPDSIPIEFYRVCWEIIKTYMIACEGKVDITRMNYGLITLLPNVKEAKKIQQYRPICFVELFIQTDHKNINS